MGNYLERISQFIEIEGITIYKLEKEVGCSKGVFLRAFKNNTDIGTKWVEIFIQKFPQVSSEWIMTGVGCMYSDEYKPQKDKDTQGRISLFCQTYGLSVDDFRKETGLTLEGIAKKYPNLNPAWLLDGKGDMFIHNMIGDNATGGTEDPERYIKRIEELERLVEQKDRMLEILMGKK